MSSVVWASAPVEQALRVRLSSKALNVKANAVAVSSANDLAAAMRHADLTFIDHTTIERVANIGDASLSGPIVLVSSEPLRAAIGWLQAYGWVAHVISTSLIEHAMADEHLTNVFRTIASERPRLLDWIKPSVAGRRVRLTHASRRAARIERMTEFLDANGVAARTTQRLRDVAEELLTNAFYDAPVAAGALPGPVPRTADIALPDECACDLAYGCSDELAVVHVRDPFGSLSRRRLVEVLARCANTEAGVDVDETMGGAGLGMWRIFANATFVAISVVKNRHTEILVGIAKRTSATRRPFAFHLFFSSKTAHPRFWSVVDDDTGAPSSVDRSIMMVTKSKQRQ